MSALFVGANLGRDNPPAQRPAPQRCFQEPNTKSRQVAGLGTKLVTAPKRFGARGRNVKLSTVSLEQWLDSTAHGFMPDGRAVRVIRVLDGDIVEVWVSGGQHFGSGGFYAGAVYAGNKPTRSRAGRTARTECVSEESEMLQFTGPCVVFSYSGDGINGGRCLRREVFLCATSDQIAQARRRVRRPMTPRGLVVVGDGEVAVNTTAANVLARRPQRSLPTASRSRSSKPTTGAATPSATSS